ncbi:MAG: hypothetical protein WKF78_07060 [Candidatus Limnocylindrales bacterium]
MQSTGCSSSGGRPLVVEDDQREFEPLKVGRRLQIGRLDDRIGVAPDIDDLADQQPLGVGRADAAAKLDAGRHDLFAQGDRHARVDLVHDQDPAQLAHDLPRRGARSDLADDRRGRVGHEHDGRAVRADLGDPPGQRATTGDHDITHRDPVIGALVQPHHPPELGRLAHDHAGGHGPVVEAGAQLEQAGQRLILATDLLESRVLAREAVVLGAKGSVVRAQSVDLGDGRSDGGDPPATPSRAPWIGRNA